VPQTSSTFRPVRARTRASAGAVPLAIAILAVSLVCAGPATAVAPAEPGTPRLASTVHAGDCVVIRWDHLPGVDELEILLSVDGGRTYPLRVSPQLEGHETKHSWRVPNLGVSGARLRLRVHRGGHEVELAPSAPFDIVADPTRPGDLLLSHEGSWWDGLNAGPLMPGALQSGASPSLGAAHATELAEAPNDDPSTSPTPERAVECVPLGPFRSTVPSPPFLPSLGVLRRRE
jgi:hypothetical protein